ncbi:cytidylate kinase [Haloactinospora alba]|uniref:Cytidylate kinase n=1 Tax=Haloactinospora alba TaxID=405555 RepID=A0A543NIB2_9ACTN|nr:(d)CMP kinase [Haloactinospora alba]TQN31494.1 cytidylate kinase [Haloactinospora alba]
MRAQGNTEGIVIAIDGPSGSGKSSTARGVARSRGLRYLDTGAMYRAVTWWMLDRNVDVGDTAAVAERAWLPELDMGTDPASPAVRVDGADVAHAIRSPEVTARVSAVSAVPAVRERLVSQQRDLIAEAQRAVGGIVVEGRDITTVVAPDAAVKIYLTASAEARAQRRGNETQAQDLAATQAELLQRDLLDSNRADSPLTRTEDALELETSGFTLDEVIAIVVGLADEATGERQHSSTL